MKLFTHIKAIHQIRPSHVRIVAGSAMKELPSLSNAWMAVKDGRIEAFGNMDDLDSSAFEGYEKIDLSGRMILPTWVDSHTHLVFADWRYQEFEDRINGLSYQEIAERGGGILNSAQKLAEASEDELYADAMDRLKKGLG